IGTSNPLFTQSKYAISIPGNTYQSGDAVVYHPGPGVRPLVNEATGTPLTDGGTYYVIQLRSELNNNSDGLIELAATYNDAVAVDPYGFSIAPIPLSLVVPSGGQPSDTHTLATSPTITLANHGFTNGERVTYQAPAPSLFQNQAIGAAAPLP